MIIEQCRWTPVNSWDNGKAPNLLGDKANLVIFFTSREILQNHNIINKLKEYYPKAEVVGCVGEPQIFKQEVTENALVVTAVQFQCSEIRVATIENEENADNEDNEETGINIIKKLPQEGLRHVFVLSDSEKTRGTSLVKGMSGVLAPTIGLTGGFSISQIYHNKPMSLGSVIAIGFYGEHLKFGYAATAGWKSYGLIRKITKSSGENLYELDGKPALESYKEFLGPFASELPNIGLIYPMSIWEHKERPQDALPRTVKGINAADNSLIFAGDVPEGHYSQFMVTNHEMLVGGATHAALGVLSALQDMKPQLALLMTCISRRLIMKQRLEEEIEAVADVLGKETAYIGFYSAGEISPIRYTEKCFFQNQTMAVTGISEDVP